MTKFENHMLIWAILGILGVFFLYADINNTISIVLLVLHFIEGIISTILGLLLVEKFDNYF